MFSLNSGNATQLSLRNLWRITLSTTDGDSRKAALYKGNIMAKLKKNILIQTSVGIVLASENRPVLKDFLKAAGVKRGSYAAELLERIHAFFIDTSIDLIRTTMNQNT